MFLAGLALALPNWSVSAEALILESFVDIHFYIIFCLS